MPTSFERGGNSGQDSPRKSDRRPSDSNFGDRPLEGRDAAKELLALAGLYVAGRRGSINAQLGEYVRDHPRLDRDTVEFLQSLALRAHIFQQNLHQLLPAALHVSTKELDDMLSEISVEMDD